jgi:hypothetical protein
MIIPPHRETIANMSKGSGAGITHKGFAERRDEALRTVFPLAYKSEDELSDVVKGTQDCPGVHFWHSKSFKPGEKYPGEVGKRLRFLEDLNGEPMKQKRLDDIRRFLNGAFRELKELMHDLLPKKGWATGADRELMARCHSELTQRFPELAYCEGDWKSRALMIEWFPSWQQIHMPEAEVAENVVKIEDSGESDSGETVTSVPAKRVAESSKKSRKKIKTEMKTLPELPDPLYISHSSSITCANMYYSFSATEHPATGTIDQGPTTSSLYFFKLAIYAR